jgi:hypothetical protein
MTKSSKMICLGVVLGFPSIRQIGAKPAKKQLATAKAAKTVTSRKQTLTSSAKRIGQGTASLPQATK